MIRKVTKLQRGGRSIILPKTWADEYKVDGEVEVTPKGNSLIITQNNSKEEEKAVVIELDTENKNRIVRTINSLYKKGHKLIRINFSNDRITDRDGKTKDTHKLLAEIIEHLEGFMIISKGKKHIVIDSIANDKLFDNTLRRSFRVLLEMAELTTDGLLDEDKETLKEAEHLYKSLRKLALYCNRTLNRQIIGEIKDIILTHSVVEMLEGIGDTYRHIAKHYMINKPNRKIKSIVVKIQELIRLMYEIYYKKDHYGMEQYFNLRDELYKDLYENSWGLDKAIAENFAYIRWMSTRVVDNLL